MLGIFRTNQLALGILLVLYALLVRAVGFWYPVEMLEVTGGVGDAWTIALLKAYPVLNDYLGIVLVFFVGIVANGIVFSHRLAVQVTLFPGVFVILASSLLPDFLSYSPYMVANLFVLLSLRAILQIYRSVSAADVIFNAGFWIGMAALWVPSFLLILPFAGITLTQLKSGRYRDQFILWIGAFFVLYMVWLGHYWYDSQAVFWDLEFKQAFALPHWVDWGGLPWVRAVAMALLVGVVLFNNGQYLAKTKMETQIKVGLLYWWLLGGLFVVLADMPWSVSHWLAVAPVTGMLLSLGFAKAKPASAEAWHFLMLVLLFFLHLAPLWKLPV
ncbi:MAG: hypothetical protein R2795_01275 [Saprospiraceae bacterium]